jgi:hypothetical protein
MSLKYRSFTFHALVAIAMTIQKSQGGTFDQVVYDYHKGREQYTYSVRGDVAYAIVGRPVLDQRTQRLKLLSSYHARGSNSENTVRLRRVGTVVQPQTEHAQRSAP